MSSQNPSQPEASNPDDRDESTEATTEPLPVTIEPPAGPVAVTVAKTENLLDRIKNVYEAIEVRAYELFESRAGHHGGDVDDWLAAESEFLRAIEVETDDTDDAFVVRAKVPGLKTSKLEVWVGPTTLVITGSTEEPAARRGPGAPDDDESPDQAYLEIFHIVDLPAGVDVSEATATLAGGVLEITVPKTEIE